jgi:hypothetical protein
MQTFNFKNTKASENVLRLLIVFLFLYYDSKPRSFTRFSGPSYSDGFTFTFGFCGTMLSFLQEVVIQKRVTIAKINLNDFIIIFFLFKKD